eukprot:1077231-Prymnesium_polylepis.1
MAACTADRPRLQSALHPPGSTPHRAWMAAGTSITKTPRSTLTLPARARWQAQGAAGGAGQGGHGGADQAAGGGEEGPRAAGAGAQGQGGGDREARGAPLTSPLPLYTAPP